MEDLEIQPQDTPEPEPPQETGHALPQTVSIEEWMASGEPGVEEAPQQEALEDAQLLAVLEACVYVAEEPLMPAQIATALNQDPERIRALMQQLIAEFDRPEHGVSIKEVAGGYKMATKPEHHEAVRNFVKSLKTPLKLSLPALETLAVIAYKQPVTTPEIMEIRGVQGGGVLKTLLDRKLITEAGRKNVIGKPILYKTTKEFLIQFGLKDLSELPSLKEFEEIGRMAMADSEVPGEAPAAPADGQASAPEAWAAETETVPAEPEASASEPAVAVPGAAEIEAETLTAPTEASAPESEAAAPEAAETEAPTLTAEPEASAPEPEAVPGAAETEAETLTAPPAVSVPESEAAAPEAPATEAETVPTSPEASTPEPAATAPQASAKEAEASAPEPRTAAPEAATPEAQPAAEPAITESQDQ
jgi:segregation and condensation protein B